MSRGVRDHEVKGGEFIRQSCMETFVPKGWKGGKGTQGSVACWQGSRRERNGGRAGPQPRQRQDLHILLRAVLVNV